MSSQLTINLGAGPTILVNVDDEAEAAALADQLNQAAENRTVEQFTVTDIDDRQHTFYARQIFQVTVIDGFDADDWAALRVEVEAWAANEPTEEGR